MTPIKFRTVWFVTDGELPTTAKGIADLVSVAKAGKFDAVQFQHFAWAGATAADIRNVATALRAIGTKANPFGLGAHVRVDLWEDSMARLLRAMVPDLIYADGLEAVDEPNARNRTRALRDAFTPTVIEGTDTNYETDTATAALWKGVFTRFGTTDQFSDGESFWYQYDDQFDKLLRAPGYRAKLWGAYERVIAWCRTRIPDGKTDGRLMTPDEGAWLMLSRRMLAAEMGRDVAITLQLSLADAVTPAGQKLLAAIGGAS
jgi:hypothetical protein